MSKSAVRKEHQDGAKDLLISCRIGALGTLEKGAPYVSHVEIAVSEELKVYLLLSDLAVHSRNVVEDNRASLMLVDPSADWIVSTRRATYQGILNRIEGKSKEICELMLRVHPDSKSFIEFGDFHFYEFIINNVRYIKGFGEMSRFAWSEGRHE